MAALAAEHGVTLSSTNGIYFARFRGLRWLNQLPPLLRPARRQHLLVSSGASRQNQPHCERCIVRTPVENGGRSIIRSYLEHVPSQLNQGDSLGAKDERVYRH